MLIHKPSPVSIRVLACIAPFCLAAHGVRAAEPIDLKLRPVKGQVQKISAIVTQKVSQNGSGVEQALDQTIGLGYTFTTEDAAADGTSTIRVCYDSVSFKQTGQLGTVEYDSANPPAQIHPMARGFAALAGQCFTMKITPTGKVIEIQGLDQMVDAILKKLEIAEGPSKALVEKAIRHEFSEDALKDNMESMLSIYPEKPVAVGDQWTRKANVAKGFPMGMENTFTLKEISADVAILAVKSKLHSNPDTAPIDTGSRKLSYTLAGEQTGTMRIDLATGWTRSAELKQKVSGEMTTDAGSGRVAKSPISIETRVVLEAK